MASRDLRIRQKISVTDPRISDGRGANAPEVPVRALPYILRRPGVDATRMWLTDIDHPVPIGVRSPTGSDEVDCNNLTGGYVKPPEPRVARLAIDYDDRLGSTTGELSRPDHGNESVAVTAGPRDQL